MCVCPAPVTCMSCSCGVCVLQLWRAGHQCVIRCHAGLRVTEAADAAMTCACVILCLCASEAPCCCSCQPMWHGGQPTSLAGRLSSSRRASRCRLPSLWWEFPCSSWASRASGWLGTSWPSSASTTCKSPHATAWQCCASVTCIDWCVVVVKCHKLTPPESGVCCSADF